MRKWAVALLVVLLIAGGILYVTSNLDGLVAAAIEREGSAASGTAVRVGRVSIDLQDASGSIGKLTVANPAGFDGGPAIEFGEFTIRLDAGSLAGDTIVIDDITVANARLHVQQQGAANNLRQLLDNLSSGGTGGNQPADGTSRKLIIRRFTLDGAQALVSVPDLDEERQIDVPKIVVRDIGARSNGATAGEAAAELLEPILRQTLSSAAATTLKDKAREKLDDVLKRIGGHDGN